MTLILSYSSFILHLTCLEDAASLASLFGLSSGLELTPEHAGERGRFTVPGLPQIARKHTMLGFQLWGLSSALEQQTKLQSPALCVSGYNSQLCAAKSRWQPWHIQWIHLRNGSSNKQLVCSTTWARLPITDWVLGLFSAHPEHTGSPCGATATSGFTL